MIEYVEIINENEKGYICNSILRELSEWFGIESAIKEYSNNVKNLFFIVARENDKDIGFIAIKKHFDKSAEIYVMGILKEYHRRGIGMNLIELAKERLRNLGIKYLTVKTLSETVQYEPYNRTRLFYINQGFEPLEEFKTLWDEENPCLFLVASI